MDLAFKALRLVIMACGEFHCERREDLDIVVKIRVDRIHEVRILTKKNFHKKRREAFSCWKIYERFRYLFGLLKRNTRFSHIKSSSLLLAKRKVTVKCGDDRGSIWVEKVGFS